MLFYESSPIAAWLSIPLCVLILTCVASIPSSGGAGGRGTALPDEQRRPHRGEGSRPGWFRVARERGSYPADALESATPRKNASRILMDLATPWIAC